MPALDPHPAVSLLPSPLATALTGRTITAVAYQPASAEAPAGLTLSFDDDTQLVVTPTPKQYRASAEREGLSFST